MIDIPSAKMLANHETAGDPYLSTLLLWESTGRGRFQSATCLPQLVTSLQRGIDELSHDDLEIPWVQELLHIHIPESVYAEEVPVLSPSLCPSSSGFTKAERMKRNPFEFLEYGGEPSVPGREAHRRISALVGEIEACELNILDKDECMEDFQKHVSPDLLLHACGACGVESYDVFSNHPVIIHGHLEKIKLSESQVVHHYARGEFAVLASVVQVKDALYFLHPECVQKIKGDGQGGVLPEEEWRVDLCNGCHHDILKEADTAKLPKFSVANGCDYGDMSRLGSEFGLEPLTFAELHLLCGNRLYGSIVQFQVLDSGSGRMKGQIIVFPHDAPRLAGEFLKEWPDVVGASKTLKVAFLGSKDEYEQFMVGVRNAFNHDFSVRVDVVYKWMSVLMKVSVKYAGLVLLDSPAVRQEVADFGTSLLENVIHMTDPLLVSTDAWLTSDVTHHAPECDVFSVPSSSTESVIPHLSHVFLGNNNAVVNCEHSAFINSTLESVREQLFPHVPVVSPPDVVRVHREQGPVSEFDNNDDLYYGCFPHLFLFGSGIPFHASFPVEYTRHLSLQRSHAFGRDARFLFTVANQFQRHAALRGVNAQVMSNPTAILKFGSLSKDDAFSQKV
jgi:hypothetical protein